MVRFQKAQAGQILQSSVSGQWCLRITTVVIRLTVGARQNTIHAASAPHYFLRQRVLYGVLGCPVSEELALTKSQCFAPSVSPPNNQIDAPACPTSSSKTSDSAQIQRAPSRSLRGSTVVGADFDDITHAQLIHGVKHQRARGVSIVLKIGATLPPIPTPPARLFIPGVSSPVPEDRIGSDFRKSCRPMPTNAGRPLLLIASICSVGLLCPLHLAQCRLAPF